MKDYLIYLKIIEEIAFDKKLEIFLVGGFLRDLYLGREFKDLDIVVNKRVDEVARYFADKIAASLVILDQKRDIYRVVKDSIYFDFAPITGGSIEDDLKRRDFTINAMACPLIFDNGTAYKLEDFLLDWTENKYYKDLVSSYIIDPYSGLDDLINKKINLIKEDAFFQDPLRLWRAIRFKSQLGFKIKKNTVTIMKESSHLAAIPAGERIREEFVEILKSVEVSEVIGFMEDEFKMMSILIPDIAEMKETGENQYHREDAWTHCLLVLQTLEELLLKSSYYEQIDKNKLYLLKLSALLHDIGKIETKSRKGEKIHYYGHENAGAERLVPILKKLKFSREELIFVKEIVRYHMKPILLYLAENLTDKGRYRFFKQVGILTPTVLIHSLADKMAGMKINQGVDEITSYQSFIEDMLKMYYEYRNKTESLLLSGKELKEYFGIREGPGIGKLLERLAEAQASGIVKNKEEALDFLKNICD